VIKITEVITYSNNQFFTFPLLFLLIFDVGRDYIK